MKYRPAAFHEIWSTFMGYFVICFCFFINHKNCVYIERCILDKLYLLLVKQKQKKSRKTKYIWMTSWLKNRNDRSACCNIFSELLLKDKMRQFKWILHPAIDYKLVFTHWHFYITYTYAYFIMYWFLHINIFKLLTLILISLSIDCYTLTFLC